MKNKTLVLLLIMAIICSLFVLAACNDDSDKDIPREETPSGEIPSGGILSGDINSGNEESGENNTAEDIVNSANQDYKGEDVDYSSYFVTDGNGKITAVSQYGIQHNEEIVQMSIPERIGDEDITAFDADLSCFPFLKSITIPQCIEVIDRSVFDTANYFLLIYCEAYAKPDGWSADWNASDWNYYYDARPVVWDCKNNEVADNGKAYCFSSKGILYALKDSQAELVFSGRESVESMELASVVKYNGASYDMTGILAYAFVSLNVIEEDEFIHYNNGSLTSVKIPNSVTSIGSLAFAELATLTKMEIPNSVKSIGDIAFGGTGISSIEIPCTVESFGEDVFMSCHSLERVKFNQGVKEIGYYMFENCDKLKVVEIPSSVTRIGDFAFSYCESLESIEIPSSVTSIGEGAFSGCTSLTIYCEAESKPSGWSNNWNDKGMNETITVVWGHTMSSN